MFTRPDDRRRGWISGIVGMLMFSGSLPATRAAVATFDPVFLTWARAAIAGTLALLVLLLRPQVRPRGSEWGSLAVVAAGCVVGFPLLTSLALREMTSADALVFIGLLPLATAVAAQLRGERRPRPAFWLFAGAGSAVVMVFALGHGGRVHGRGALLMLAAVVVSGWGYAEGGRLARRLGGWQVISWALVLALPATLPLADMMRPEDWTQVGAGALAGLAYVSIISMLVGFVFWYDGLARGGTAAVGQLQLVQPFFGLLAAALVLHETVAPAALFLLAGTIVCAAGARRFAATEPRAAGTALGAVAGLSAFAIMLLVGGTGSPARAASFPERLYDWPAEPPMVPSLDPQAAERATALSARRSQTHRRHVRP